MIQTPASPAGGLSSSEAAARRQRDGPNLLPQEAPKHWPRILGGVLREPMLLLLVGAAAIYLLLGDPGEAIALLCSVIAIVGLTFYQEARSEHALQALRDLSSPRARVLRDGWTCVIAGADVVVGDVLQLEEGDRVAADATLQSAQDLMIDESLLTGESAAVHHEPAEGGVETEGALVRASTLVVRGRGRAVVTAIGSATAVGNIHAAMRNIRPQPSPMQREMRKTVLAFAGLGAGVSCLVILLHVRAYGDWLQALLAGLTLAIANIPEEFPVVVAVFLALGAWRMARQRALVRRAPAIETLGAITVLCTDKTGTLTQNRMRIAELQAGSYRSPPMLPLPAPLQDLLEWADRASPTHPHDPMEIAIREALPAPATPFSAQRLREYPFSPQLTASATLWRVDSNPALVAAGKGAPETMLELCGVRGAAADRILIEVGGMASRGLRVIGVARGFWNGPADALPPTAGGFTWQWVGLIGLADPLRDGVAEAVGRARSAGIRVLMLTGDHLTTARAIARSAGIAGEAEGMLASELDGLDDGAYTSRIADCRVFARMRPEQKLRLVDALRAQGEIVAMTGDGVNDAPSLLAAHVGIAMGGRGTDVAREAAALVLLDDNFVTVVEAIGAGRAIYDNIKRAVGYILAVHVPITGLALLPLLLGTPLVLMPLHVVFLELIIDPASTIVFERAAADPRLMRRPPRSPKARLLDTAVVATGLAKGAIAFLAVAAIYLLGRQAGLASGQLAAAAFTALVSGNVALIRGNLAGATVAVRKNRAFQVVALAAGGLLFLVVGVPTLGRWFHFDAPPAWAVLSALALPWVLLGVADQVRKKMS